LLMADRGQHLENGDRVLHHASQLMQLLDL